MEDAIKDALQALGLKMGDPGWRIAGGPNSLSRADEPNHGLRNLMQNFFEYGHGPGEWQWQSALGNASGPDSYVNPRHRGINLLNGTCKVTNCDGFRLAFINLATNVLDIADVTVGDIGPIQDGGYLTRPHTRAIDRHWVGNVRTESKDFAQVGSFKFSEHHFARLGAGHLYDPTTNETHGGEDELKWCSYALEVDPTVQAHFQGLRLFRITAVHHVDVACQNPRYLVEIGSSGGWPTNLLTSQDHLDLGTIALMTAGTSRI